MDNGIEVAIYQGERGANPDLDFIVKYREPGKRLRAPSHTHWIVDAVIKGIWFNRQTSSYFDEWLRIYDVMEPFQNVEERDNYCLLYRQYMVDNYSDMDGIGVYSVEFISTIIELFIRCEKQTPNAFMFKSLLQMMKEFGDGKKDFYQVVGYSKRV